MLPDYAQKKNVMVWLPDTTEQISVHPVFDTLNNTAVAVRYYSGRRFEMVEQKMWYEDLHIRHTIRIYASGLILLMGVGDVVLNIFGVGYWDLFSDLIWIIGSLGILGASTYMAIDANGE
jgi:hypothetical protein